jgi:hypothetical protein
LRGLTNLQSIDLSSNDIRNFAPLLSLPKLRNLKIRSNYLSSIEGIENLEKLEKLDLTDNLIVDPSPALRLKKLKELRLHGNQFSPSEIKQDVWQKMKLDFFTFSDDQACQAAAESLLNNKIILQAALDHFLGINFGPLFSTKGDQNSEFQDWINCSVAARSI